MQRKNALGPLQGRTTDEQHRLHREVVRLTRKLRWKIDQELVRRDIRPVFKENLRTYDRKEFVLDADIEVSKIRFVLEKSPELLMEDPLLGVEYLKILDLMKKTKLVEYSSNAYDPAEAAFTSFYDSKEEEDAKEKEQ
mmetsp:Transcript_25448/g.24779  ORF Transcript_25448/g.24779 Transcript_25448/m.24779 type:complete len:138 (-) Transcript_25448:290-703(-)